MPDFEFQDDVGGSFPITFEAHEIALAGETVTFALAAYLDQVPMEHQTFAAQVARENLILDVLSAIRRELKSAGLPVYKLRPGPVEINF